MIFGYARVSSTDQNLDRQLDAFKKFGVEKIYSDKMSGKNFERINYVKMLEELRGGDLLVIKSIDRLGRNYDMIIDEWRKITKEIGADIVVIDMPLLDTRDKEKGLTGKFISDLVLQILSYVAETERNNIKQRQAEGIRLAKEKGIHMGRPRKNLPDNFKDVYIEYSSGKITIKDALEKTNLSNSTFYKYVKILGLTPQNSKVNVIKSKENITLKNNNIKKEKSKPKESKTTIIKPQIQQPIKRKSIKLPIKKKQEINLPDNFHNVCNDWKTNNITTKESCEKLNLTQQKFYIYAHKMGYYREKNNNISISNEIKDVINQWADYKITNKEALIKLNVSQTHFYKYAKMLGITRRKIFNVEPITHKETYIIKSDFITKEVYSKEDVCKELNIKSYTLNRYFKGHKTIIDKLGIKIEKKI